jgi:glycosyltransferase involved in cell wall biosynthesis
VHDEYGYFDESMVTSGDYEFWLRISQTHNFYHINTPLGLYLKSPESIEHGNREKQRKENQQILSLYRDAAQKGRIVQYGTLDKSLQSPKEKNISNIVKKSFISGLTSIVIHSLANLKHLRQCIQELEKYTAEQYEIIFVDYNSPADIKMWLKKQIEAVKHYRYITANRDQSFVNALNNGISESSGEFIALLSSDVMVSENWLSDMLGCLQSAVRPAIVGPMADNVFGQQNVQDANLKSLDEIKAFRERNRYRRIQTRNLEGFCMLFRRQLVIDIGLLDETFLADKYVFNDFCFRAILAGHRNVIAGDVFLHNYGSSMSGNIQIFDEKWTGIDVNTPLGKKVAAFNIIDKADTLNQKGQLDKAIAMFMEGIKYSQDEKAVYYRLAEMLLDAKLHKDTMEAVDAMPQEMRDDLKRLEIIAYCAEDIEEAGKLADRILAVNKDYAAAINLKGINAYKQGDNSEAEDFFRKAILADPGYGEPYTNIGIMKCDSDQKEDALNFLERGFILSPTLTDNVTLYHMAITALEQYEKAEKLFQEAKELHPENKRILFLLIDIFIKQGKFYKAMHEIEQAMLNMGIDGGMLAAALEIRDKVGVMEIDKAAKKGALSLCMIVKNEEQHLTRCLLSVKPAVDEMIVVDTGSTDSTKDIARAFGAKVFDFPWTNDFSEARNFSLSKAFGDWILVLDADEVISVLDYASIEKIVKKKVSKPAAYTLVTRNYTNEVNSKGWVANDRKYLREEAGTGWFPSAKVRLFANDKRIQFQNPVHEFVEGSLEKAGIEIKASDIPVHHYGRFDKDKILAKGKEYFLLGKKKIDQMKDDIKALKELAIQASELGEYVTAVELWKRVIELNPNDSVAFLNIGYAYMKLDKYEDALVSSRNAMKLDPAMKEAALNYAGSEFIIGDIKKTISVLEALLRKDSYYPPAMAVVAAAYHVDGQKERAAELFEKLRKKGFDCTEFFDEQIRTLMSHGRFDHAFALLEAAINSGSVNKDTKILLAECHRKMVTKLD